MCLIVCKPVGRKLPSNRELSRWFKSHSDGMGMMFNDGLGQIHILKGGMNVKDMFNLHEKMIKLIRPLKPSDVNIVYHFRQATEGSIGQSNCHPFPITKDKAKLALTDTVTDMAIVHNGIIWDYGTYTAGKWDFNTTTETTDTQKFIEDYLVDMGQTVFNPGVQALIIQATDSKFAILSLRGITMIGVFTEDKGLQFSNGGYKECIPLPAKVSYAPPLASLDDYHADRSKFNEERCELCDQYVDSDDIVDTGEMFICNECYKYFDDWQEGDGLENVDHTQEAVLSQYLDDAGLHEDQSGLPF